MSESTVEKMAASLRESYAGSFFDGMRGPTSMFADRVESCYVPPRSTDGWFDGKALHDYQVVEERAMRAVLPDARFTDVKVITRADDQIIVVFTLSGHMRDGHRFELPTTMVYDVEGDKIVRVTGIYNQEQLRPFAEAFAEVSKTDQMLIEIAPSATR